MNKDEYFYKVSKVKGREYLQIWKRINGGSKDKAVLIRTVGNAHKLNTLLVRLQNIENQTNKIAENLTNLTEGNK